VVAFAEIWIPKGDRFPTTNIKKRWFIAYSRENIAIIEKTLPWGVWSTNYTSFV
jgi:hypothetical protein